jgi:hypothetical protein
MNRHPGIGPGAGLLLLLLAGGAAAAGKGDLKAFLGTWRGTSLCVNRTIAPACNDETVVYEVRRAEKPDAVILAADKIVEGKRLPMGELEFVYSEPEGCWRGEFTTPRAHGVWCLVVEGKNLRGSLRHMPENVDVRKVQAVHD